MTVKINPTRRGFLKTFSIAIAAAPLAVASQKATAAINAAAREKFKYQDSPSGDFNCANCLDFIPGKTATALGKCNKFPGDDEISPNAYCTAWNTM
jgi:hypothetical protein